MFNIWGGGNFPLLNFFSLLLGVDNIYIVPQPNYWGDASPTSPRDRRLCLQTVVSNDLDKANVLSGYFSSVFNTDSIKVLPACDVKCSVVMHNIMMDTDDVKKRLNNLHVYKSYGHDMLHPRILNVYSSDSSLLLLINKHMHVAVVE